MNQIVLALQRIQQALHQGKQPEALAMAQRLAADPKLDPRVFMDLGMMFFQAGQYSPAIDYLGRAERIPASRWVAAFYRSIALDLVGRLVEARALLKQVVAAQPVEPAYVEYVKLLLKCGAVQEASEVLDEAQLRFPNLVAVPVLRARIELARGEAEKAQVYWEEAISRVQNDKVALAEILCERGYVLQSLGEFDKAGEAFLASAAANPKLGRPYSMLFHTRKVTPDDAEAVAQAEARLAAGAQGEDAYYLHFALAKAKNDAKDFESASYHYDQANTLGRRVRQNENQKVGGAVQTMHSRIERVLTRENIAPLAERGNPTAKPLFIMGMIRTGTTLMEQILSSHKDVSGAGELEFWVTNAPFLMDFERNRVVEPVLRKAAESYLELLDMLGDQSARVTDKSPPNLTFAGLLHAAFPNARMICMRRKPIDVAMSVWMTPIASVLGDKRDVVEVIRETNRLADYWSEVLPPDRFKQVRYEDLIADRESVLREVLEFVGLPWDPGVLSHEQNQREVLTPSMWQVRQKVYTTSMDRWRPYEPWLGDFADLIGEN